MNGGDSQGGVGTWELKPLGFAVFQVGGVREEEIMTLASWVRMQMERPSQKSSMGS